MPRLEWTPQAVADLLAIIAYIADRNPDAAQALKDEIEAKAVRLPERPRIYRRGRGRGHARDGRVAELPERVRVLRVLHAARQWP